MKEKLNEVIEHFDEGLLDFNLLIDAVEALSDGFIIFDAGGRMLHCNRKYLEIYAPSSQNWPVGSSLEKIARDTATYCIGLENADLIEQFVEDRLSRHKLSHSWSEQLLQNGRWIRVGESNLKNGWSVGIRTDITGLKSTEAELLKSETRFRDYAETAADYFWEIDRDQSFSHIAGGFETATGYPSSQFIGLAIDDFFRIGGVNFDPAADPLAVISTRQRFADYQFQWKHADGSVRVLAIAGKPVLDENGNFSGYRGSCSDISKTVKLKRKLSYLASHDSMTKLINRHEFELRLRALLKDDCPPGTEHTLCFIDLDQFKVINDSCGHAAGDELLRQLADLLRTQVRKQDTVARLGGDEFGILMNFCPLEIAEAVVDGYRQAIESYSFHWEGNGYSVGASIGLVPITADSESMTQLMREADTACYSAKEQGRNRIMVYHPGNQMMTRHQGEMDQLASINSALQNDGFELFYQPLVSLKETVPSANIEILLRMRDGEGELILPGNFLAVAERYFLMNKIDRWVITQTFSWLRQNSSKLDNLSLCAINLSGHSLGDDDFFRFVDDQLRTSELDTSRICFEITETAAISNLSRATAFIKHFKVRGCKFALDDFGSGLASFAYLKDLPVDILKIDGSFVRDCQSNPTNLAIVQSIQQIGGVMGLDTVAEFVENDSVLELMRCVGVDYAQGYCFQQPAPLEQFLIDFDGT